MSQRKCMSFLKCSVLGTEKVTHFNFITTKIEGQPMISNKQNFENEAFKVNRKLNALAEMHVIFEML